MQSFMLRWFILLINGLYLSQKILLEKGTATFNYVCYCSLSNVVAFYNRWHKCEVC